jgi:hypothetical protein
VYKQERFRNAQRYETSWNVSYPSIYFQPYTYVMAHAARRGGGFLANQPSLYYICIEFLKAGILCYITSIYLSAVRSEFSCRGGCTGVSVGHIMTRLINIADKPLLTSPGRW